MLAELGVDPAKPKLTVDDRLKAASALIAEATGASKREIYDRGLALQAGRGDGAES